MKQATSRKAVGRFHSVCRTGLNLLTAFLFGRYKEAGENKKFMFKNIFTKKVPFIGWVEFKEPHNEPYGDLGVFIVNPTNKTYEKVELFTGMFQGDMDGLLESGKGIGNLGILKPHSSIRFDAMTWYDMDYHFWYHFDFYHRLNERPKQYWFEIGFYDWKEDKIKLLPVLNTKGMEIALEPRDGLSIREEVEKTYLEARYTPTKE